MKWFRNASTRMKLLAGFGTMMLLLAAVFATAYLAISSLIRAQQTVFKTNFSEVIDALNFDANQGDIRVAMLTMLSLTNRGDIDKVRQMINDRSQEANVLLRRLIQQNQIHPDTLGRLEQWQVLRDEYKTTRENQIVPALLQGRPEEARELLLTVQRERFERMRKITGELVNDARSEAQRAADAAERKGRNLLWAAAGVGLASLVIGWMLVSYMNRLIAAPLRDLLGWTEKAASGDLTVEIPATSRRDEVGVLHEGFREMLQNLRTMNSQVKESIDVLVGSATEILTATSEMAATASETAAATTQTTATVEEVKQTSQVTSAKSKQVADIAKRAARDSESGRNAVDEGVEGMNQIRSQMDRVAESIVRLSEQSQAIGEIISSVNDLAEQSNLLAVNASIEAAKAGEHGKGFAVVAQEIRSLAGQSKQATAQVRTILGEIQRATSAAAMAAEQGSKAVETGVEQSSQAGEAIRALAESINEAAEAAQQISASSEQQSVGMDQVAQAMENIKQAAGQNASATRQAESGARNLHQLGQKLQGLIQRFRM